MEVMAMITSLVSVEASLAQEAYCKSSLSRIQMKAGNASGPSCLGIHDLLSLSHFVTGSAVTEHEYLHEPQLLASEEVSVRAVLIS